jgi:hypothetical protein
MAWTLLTMGLASGAGDHARGEKDAVLTWASIGVTLPFFFIFFIRFLYSVRRSS